MTSVSLEPVTVAVHTKEHPISPVTALTLDPMGTGIIIMKL